MSAHDLISISPPDRLLDADLLDVPGGFAWWYMDLVNEQGQGVVLIWSFGLPFLPGLAASARAGSPQLPRQRPSLNVAIYEDSKLDCYLLEEFDPQDVVWNREANTWRFGTNHICLTRTPHALNLHVTLDCAIAGTPERLTGSIAVRGTAREPVKGQAPTLDPNHDWTPLMGPAHGHVQVSLGQARCYDFEGRAYHDRNGGRAPLEELGFSHWIWGRLPFKDRELIYYILWPEEGDKPVCVGMEILADGTTLLHEDVSVTPGRLRRDVLGMRWHEEVVVNVAGEPWLAVRPEVVLDQGPFYLRFFVEAVTPAGERARGMGEACRPERIDLAHHRPLVKMRVTQALPHQNSMWLPLFTGPQRGRLERLVKYQLVKHARHVRALPALLSMRKP